MYRGNPPGKPCFTFCRGALERDYNQQEGEGGCCRLYVGARSVRVMSTRSGGRFVCQACQGRPPRAARVAYLPDMHPSLVLPLLMHVASLPAPLRVTMDRPPQLAWSLQRASSAADLSDLIPQRPVIQRRCRGAACILLARRGLRPDLHRAVKVQPKR